MASHAQKNGRTENPPISTHRAFPPIVAAWFATLLGLGSLVVPVALIEQLVVSTGISGIVSAASPPLGMTARILIALGFALSGALIGLLIARKVAQAHTQQDTSHFSDTVAAANARRPISAHDELGNEGLDGDTQRRRKLTIAPEDHPDAFLDFAPLPGGFTAAEEQLEEQPEEEPVADVDVELAELAELEMVEAADNRFAEVAEPYSEAQAEENAETPSENALADNALPGFTSLTADGEDYDLVTDDFATEDLAIAPEYPAEEEAKIDSAWVDAEELIELAQAGMPQDWAEDWAEETVDPLVDEPVLHIPTAEDLPAVEDDILSFSPPSLAREQDSEAAHEDGAETGAETESETGAETEVQAQPETMLPEFTPLEPMAEEIEDAQDAEDADTPVAEPAWTYAPLATAAKVDWQNTSVQDLGMVQLAERLGSSIGKRRAMLAKRAEQAAAQAAALAASIAPMSSDFDMAEPSEAAEAMAAYFGTPVSGEQQAPSMQEDSGMQEEGGAHQPAEHFLSSTSAPIEYHADEHEGDEYEAGEYAAEDDANYGSLLAVKSPSDSFDEDSFGEDDFEYDEEDADLASALPPMDEIHAVKAVTATWDEASLRSFDPPVLPAAPENQVREDQSGPTFGPISNDANVAPMNIATENKPNAQENDRALREALLNLQRMSGAA